MAIYQKYRLNKKENLKKFTNNLIVQDVKIKSFYETNYKQDNPNLENKNIHNYKGFLQKFVAFEQDR